MKFIQIIVICILLFSNCKYYCDDITAKQTTPSHKRRSYSGKTWRNVTVPVTYIYKTSKNNFSVKTTREYNIGESVKIKQLGDMIKILGKCDE